jgi:hypothetical protein
MFAKQCQNFPSANKTSAFKNISKSFALYNGYIVGSLKNKTTSNLKQQKMVC